jgi:hypothetical protein
MTRMLAFVAALLLTAITVSSACIANVSAPLQFTIEPSRDAGSLQLRFKRDRNGHSENTWDSSFRATELAGLDVAALDGPGSRPIRFTLSRDAGRIDCVGNGGNAMARGTCAMVPNAEFNRFLADHGIGAPSEDETFGMIALNVRRELVDALARAHYPTPSVEKLIELTAVEATPVYIGGLSAQGYRPKTLDGLVQFAALKITPDYIGSFVRAGYSNLPADDLVELKALNITPEFIAGFERIGYGHLPVDTLVQLKAMDITPDYVRAVAQGGALPSPDHLVQLKAVSDDIRKR